MPTPGKKWFHVTLGTYASWLPGDPRGFRSRDHRLHSSGDHRNPPPPGEHAGLHRYAKKISGPTTVLPASLRPIIGRKLRDHALKLEHQVLAVCVGAKHAHLQVELPMDDGAADHEIGRCKQAAALAVRDTLAGKKLWAGKAGFKPITDKPHQKNVRGYIRKHTDEWAWVWVKGEGEIGPLAEAEGEEGRVEVNAPPSPPQLRSGGLEGES